MKLKLTITTFFERLPEIIKSGATFTAVEDGDNIVITFTGGY